MPPAHRGQVERCRGAARAGGWDGVMAPGTGGSGSAIEALHAEGNGRLQGRSGTDDEAVAAMAPKRGHAECRVGGLGLDPDRIRLTAPGPVLGEPDLLPQPDTGEDIEWPREPGRESEPVVADPVGPFRQAIEEPEQEPARGTFREPLQAAGRPRVLLTRLHPGGVGDLDPERSGADLEGRSRGEGLAIGGVL